MSLALPAPAGANRAQPSLACHSACRQALRVLACAVLPAGFALAAEPAAQPYVDRVIDGLAATPDLASDAVPGFDASGPARALRFETRGQSSASGQGRESALWLSLRAAVDTDNYGAFSLDASTQAYARTLRQRRGSGSSLSLYQTAMPFGGGWQASQALGVIQTLSPRLAAQQAAFFVPSRLVQGASTQWRNDEAGVTWQLGGGETGSFASIGQGSFYGSGNRVAVLGFEAQRGRAGQASLLPPGWSYSALASTASGSAEQTVPGLGLRSAEPAGKGLLQSLRWESAAAHVQGNLLATRNDPTTPAPAMAAGVPGTNRNGGWLDGALVDGAVSHRWGLHHLDANLNWQGSALGGNTQGGYYRWSQFGLRTQVEAQVSTSQPIDAALGGTAQRQAGLSLRHQIDQRLGIGGVAQLSSGVARGVLLSGYSEIQRPWAELRLQASIESQRGSIVAHRISSDQAWALPIGQRLRSSFALNSSRSITQDSQGTQVGAFGTTLELALVGGLDVDERLSLDLNSRASLPQSSQLSRLYNVSASGQWRFAPAWSLAASLGLSRTSGQTTAPGVNPIPPLPGSLSTFVYPGTSTRDAWLTLRYEFQAGSAPVPIGTGGRVGGGGGNIVGVVYLDGNDNGRLDALEARAANVTVTLDGRYATRTDAQGRFEFPFVAPGPHRLQVASDTLPLPWMMATAEALRADVAPRETTRIEIGASRDRIGNKEP